MGKHAGWGLGNGIGSRVCSYTTPPQTWVRVKKMDVVKSNDHHNGVTQQPKEF